MYQFRDPIHGFIEISDLELKIIDTAAFQRLRNIKQLATTYLVYHGAEHTRFGHSLGVMHLVSKAFDSALDNYKRSHDEDIFCDIRRAWYRQILRLIALTHDLGHAPFSHASEALFDGGLEHEDFTKKIICETEIAGLIADIGKDFQRENGVGESYDITADLLWLIYGKKNPEMDHQYVMPDYAFLRSFMDSEIDCDKMDYLLRDSYYCGVNYGRFDANRLISSLNVYKAQNAEKDENILQLAIDRGGIHAFEEFVTARYFMFIQVYFHKTRRYLDSLLVANIKSILPNSKYPSDVNDYLSMDDDYIIAQIKAKEKDCPLAQQYMKRQVMSCVYATASHSNVGSDLEVFNMIKNQLKDNLGTELFIDEARKLAHKIPMLEQYDEFGGKGIPIIVPHSSKPKSVSQESVLLQGLDKPINIKRIYVEKTCAKRAREIVSELLKEEA